MADYTIKARITEAMKDAMRAKDKDRLGAIRLIQADIKRIEVDERIEVDDERMLAATPSASTRPPAARSWPIGSTPRSP